jgi:hypothetical protein
VKVAHAPADSAASLLVLRGGNSSRLGLVLAFFVLLAQIAGPGLHPPALVSSANGAGKLAIAFGAHALCLAPDTTEPGPPAPADKAPKAHHDFAACCFWHGSIGAVLAAAAALVKPVAFGLLHVGFAAPSADTSPHKSGTAWARGPPVGAQHLVT